MDSNESRTFEEYLEMRRRVWREKDVWHKRLIGALETPDDKAGAMVKNLIVCTSIVTDLLNKGGAAYTFEMGACHCRTIGELKKLLDALKTRWESISIPVEIADTQFDDSIVVYFGRRAEEFREVQKAPRNTRR